MTAILLALAVRALPLVSLPHVIVDASEAGGPSILYRAGCGPTVRGRMPWALEALDRHPGVGPAIVPKGPL